MGMKSRLFASAAFPLLSLSMVMQPVHSFAAAPSVEQTSEAPRAISGSFEVAQDASDEELLKKRRKQQQEGGGEQAPQAEQPAQQEAPAERPRKQREPQAEQQEAPAMQQEAPAERPRKQREPQAEQQEAPAMQQEAPAERPRKQRQPAAEQQAEPQAEQAQPAQEQPAEKPKRNKREKQPEQQEAAPQQQDQAAPQEQQAQPQAEEPQQPRKQRDKQPEKQPSAAQGEEQPAAKPPRKKPTAAEAPQDEQKPAETEQATPQQPEGSDVPKPAEAPEGQKAGKPVAPTEGKAPQPEQQPQTGEQQPAGEQPPVQQGEQAPPQPNGQPAAGQAEQAIPAPEKVTPKELERRKEIAADPSKSTETVVLPVENGAAVLDSDKDADRSGGVQSRRDRDKQREQEQNVRVPKSDADAQVAPSGEKRPPIKIEAVTSEQGERLDRRPQFERPDGAQFGQRGNDNRVIIQFNNQTYVRGDDDRRFLRDGERPIYEQLPRDRYRETIDRDGYQIVTVRNRYGDIIQRSRIDNRGRESVLYYSPELYDDPDRSYFEDPGADLPPMRLRIPLRDYIMDTSSDDDRDYYDFLREPPVEPVERVYSLDEVKYSARIRDKVRRIDLDTITFATGSAEIPMSQARSLRKVADAINEVLQKDPSETFLIEGHTDAVGSDQSNLVLSDQRAESVANVMSDVYGIPPENLATQGYGERYLKVNTQGPNQENRRVTIRRVTALVRPVASRN